MNAPMALSFTIYNTGPGGTTFGISNSAGYDSTSQAFYTSSGVSTFHTFDGVPQADSLFLTITLNGDFNSSSEYADLVIEGAFWEQINDGNTNTNTDVVVNYVFGGTNVQNWLADGQLDIEIDNNSAVDAFGATDYHIVEVLIPGVSWLQLSALSDTLAPGDSATIDATFYSGGLDNGVYLNDLGISSNDPDNPNLLLPTTLTVSGNADLTLTDTALNFNTVIVGSTASHTITFYNNGCDSVVYNQPDHHKQCFWLRHHRKHLDSIGKCRDAL